MKKNVIILGLLIVLVIITAGDIPWTRILNYSLSIAEKINERQFVSRDVSIDGIEAEAVLMMDAKTGKVIYNEHGNQQMYPASTTKILTALIALEQGDPDDLITVGREVQIRTAGESSAYLQMGQRLSVRDLVAAMMLPSGNDAARAAAVYVARIHSGEELEVEEAMDYFANLMNARAKKLGARHSHFVNPHGLHDADHYTTAKDMALIAQAAMNNKTLRDIVRDSEYRAVSGNGDVVYQNRNKLLRSDSEYYYEGAIGMKTGYTDKAGYCLVTTAKREGKTLITVVLHSTEDGVWTDSRKLLDYGFDL